VCTVVRDVREDSPRGRRELSYSIAEGRRSTGKLTKKLANTGEIFKMNHHINRSIAVKG
jgi:hypothetical protein